MHNLMSQYQLVIIHLQTLNRFASRGGDATFETMGNFITFQRDHQQQRAPMFLASAVGCHYLQMFGAAWDGDSVCGSTVFSNFTSLCTP